MARTRGTVSIDCPHCGEQARVRHSVMEAALSKFLRYICTNDDCGHIFAAQIEIIHTIRPPLVPNPAVTLKISPSLQRRPANDAAASVILPPPANDQAELLEA